MFRGFVVASSSGLFFLDSLVSFGCSCGAAGVTLRAERRVEVRRSFPVFLGSIVVWDSFFSFFLMCLGDS